MKRCSQCEFTFEDQPQFCDFDGTELTVVPESVPSLKNISVPPAVSPSLFLSIICSRVSLAVLALGGLMLSALVIGYYDSGSQSIIEANLDLAANAESRTDVMNLVPQGAFETLDRAKRDQVQQPRFIFTERRIRAQVKSSSMPSSTISRPSTASLTRVHVPSSTSKPEGNKRRLEKTNREWRARDPKRPAGRESESAHQKKDSKVLAILKKTGRILKKPFEF